MGGGFGRIFKIGNQPVNLAFEGFWNAVKPDSAGEWTMQATFTLLFPKKK